MSDIHATYSPEDNKLRLYPSARLDEDTYNRVKAAGFRWAPKQELFVAPQWTPAREDLAIELAGEIEPEGLTMADRAAAKAERLEDLAHKRAREAGAYSRAAANLARCFEGGQPILVGHHSEAKARRTQKRLHATEDKARKAARAAEWWTWKANSAEAHANRKHAPGVRTRRIKSLLSELRGLQRDLAQARQVVALLESADAEKMGRIIEAGHIGGVYVTRTGDYQRFKDDPDSVETIRAERLESWRKVEPHKTRWIMHTLHRLAFERELLGDPPRYDGDITAVILQAFAREQGAIKPKASPSQDGDSWTVASADALPIHWGDAKSLTKTADEWRAFMVECGHAPTTEKTERQKNPRRTTAPLVNLTNEDAERLQASLNAHAARRGGSRIEPQAVAYMTSEQYQRRAGGSYAPHQVEKVSECGRITREGYSYASGGREPAAAFRTRFNTSTPLYAARQVIVLTDKPQKPAPVDLASVTEAAQ